MKVNANPLDATIAYEFSRWKYSNGQVIAGLISRRSQEAELYFTGIPPQENKKEVKPWLIALLIGLTIFLMIVFFVL